MMQTTIELFIGISPSVASDIWITLLVGSHDDFGKMTSGGKPRTGGYICVWMYDGSADKHEQRDRTE